MSSASFAPISTFPLTFIPFSALPSGVVPTITSAVSTPTPSAFSNSSAGLPSNGNGFRTNASTELLWEEQTVNAAAYLAAIAWGLYLAIFYKAVVNIVKNKNRTNLRWLPFVGGLFATATISMCCFANFNEQAWIDQRNYPNGPLYFLNEQQHLPVYVIAIVASLVVQTLGQGFLVYRSHVLWGNIWMSTIWMTIPLAIWAIASFALSLGFAIMVADSRIRFSLGSLPYPINLNESSIELAMAFNIVVTALLVGRLTYLAPKVPTSFPNHIRVKFMRADALLTESVLLLGIISLVYVCLFGEGSTGANLFFPLIVQLEAIFPTLIVIRIVQGWGWDSRVIGRTPTDYNHSYARGADVMSSDTASDIAIKEALARKMAANAV